jgi:NAD(P)-dependent dehydrogenase (short-subunit alcohol dehydrogenase family)
MVQPKTAIVTGGGSGIGLATVQALLKADWRVAILDRDALAIERSRGVFGDAAQVLYHELDITDEQAVSKAIGAIAAECGPIRGVVNSAGVVGAASVVDTTGEAFRKTVDINLTGTFLVAREATRYMRTGGGAIVNVASVSAIRGYANRAAYAASKGGVVALTKQMAVELAPQGIRVNAIAPGPVETPMVEQFHSTDSRESLIRSIPQRRYGTAGEMAGVIVFLLDDAAAGFVTGQLIAVDGGTTASAGWFPSEK